jgi:hypothetical protein
MEHNTSFSVTDCRTMAQKLNSRLSNFCLAHGCPPCSIVAAEDVEGGVVRFTLGRVR